MEYRSLSEQEYEDFASRILYEDNHILVVNKKVGEITQGDKTGDECLADSYKAFIAARDTKPGKVFMGTPHRLDRPVEGITILAKTSKALERLTQMFREGNVHKTYWALCTAAPQPEEGLLEDRLDRNGKLNKTFVCKNGGKVARLRYRLLLKTQRYFLVEVELLTGRHHQIRCQLSHIGCPIKGDLKYGAPRSNPDGGICLQSHSIKFEHPVKHTEIKINLPVPQNWKISKECENL